MLRPLDFLGLSLFEWLFFIVLSLFPARFVVKHLGMPSYLLPLTCMAVLGLFGWIDFWCYFIHPNLGIAFSLALASINITLIGFSVIRRDSSLLLALKDEDIALPLLLTLFALIAYNSYLFLPDYGSSVRLEDYAQKRFFGSYSSDNTLPLLFASKLANGEALKPFYSDWLSSDRPPLQTGIVLMQWFAAQCVNRIELAYQTCASLLQLSWILAVWAIARAGSLRPTQTSFMLLCCFTNPGFFLVHSTYVWPKFIAGSYIVFAIILLFLQGLTYPRMFLAGLSIALGMLSHGSAVFTLLAVGALMIFSFSAKRLSYPLVSAFVAVLFYLPWLCYQKFYDPPGQRLIKWHIAGQIPIDGRGIGQTLREAYAALPWDKIIENKITNLKYLIRGWGNWTIPMDPAPAFDARLNQFYSHARMMGIMNLGLILLPAILFFFRKDPRTKQWLLLSLLAGIGTLLWSLLIFIPEQNIIHQGSFASTLLIFLVAAWALSFLPKPFRFLLIAFQSVQFVLIWVVPTTLPLAPKHQWFLWSLLTGVIGIGVCCLKRIDQVKLRTIVREQDQSPGLDQP